MFNLNSGEERQLTEQTSLLSGLDWSPDGQYLVVAEGNDYGIPSYDGTVSCTKGYIIPAHPNKLADLSIIDYSPAIALTSGGYHFCAKNFSWRAN